MIAGNVRVGLAGWSYPDWRGTFYPRQESRGFSELRYAAELFDCLEINSSFYRTPSVRVCEGWLRQVEDLEDFQFTAKLCRDVTHGPRSGPGRRHEPPPPTEAARICREFRESIAPLSEARKLGAVLAQFPWYFDDTKRARELLQTIAESLSPLNVVVELRHRSFFETGEHAALPFLDSSGLNFANIDLPSSSTSPPLTTVNTGPIGYFRLHGRNSASWFDRSAGRDEKYDYLYAPEELAEIAPAISRVADRARTTYVIANNHYRGQAPANAIELMRMLSGRVPEIPEPLRTTFPGLGELSSEPMRGASRSQ